MVFKFTDWNPRQQGWLDYIYKYLIHNEPNKESRMDSDNIYIYIYVCEYVQT